MHKKSEKKDEIDDKKVAVPPVTRAVHVAAIRRVTLQQGKAEYRPKALRRRAASMREKSGSRARSPNPCLLEASKVTIGAGEHRSVDLSAQAAAAATGKDW